jgi:hypothetical protein
VHYQILFALVSLLSSRVRSRASLEVELIALRHQLIVLGRQRPYSQNTELKLRSRQHLSEDLLFLALERPLDRPSIAV